jgi:hypothetical protein
MLPPDSDFDVEGEASFIRRTLQQFIDDARHRLKMTECPASITISFGSDIGFKLQLWTMSAATVPTVVALEALELTQDPSDAVDEFVERILELINSSELTFDTTGAYLMRRGEHG